MEGILEFIGKLRENNNRDWFNEHKADYNAARQGFENHCVKLIAGIGEFDSPIASLSPKECMFRIYRDMRFSYDKTPYKTHFGAYMAFPGGRKSERSGYYIHLDPVDGCFFGAGIWCPEANLLKALRQSICDNYEEFNEIRQEKEFFLKYGNSLFDVDKLKSMPRGFPKDFPEPELLKLKHYFVSHDLNLDLVKDANFVDYLVNLARIAYPFNQFLNYVVDEEL